MSKKFHIRTGYRGEGPLRKFVIPERKIDEAKREIDFIISTSGRDRDGDVIMQDGWDLSHYVKNPIMLWAHDGSSPPIARAKSIRMQDSALIATAKFATKEEYEFADTVFRLYKGGFLSAVSVGFQPTEMELMEGPEPGDFGFRFLKQELMEFSAVPIPSNPEALIVARGSGFNVAPMKEWIEHTLDNGEGGSSEDLLQKSFIALNGKLHPSLQGVLAERNLNALRKVPAEEEVSAGVDEENVNAEEEEVEPVVVATGPTDNPDASDPHTHELEVGAAQTEPEDDDGHIHAVEYEDDGTINVEGAEGHSHDVNATAPVIEDDEAEEQDNGDVDTEEDIAIQTPIPKPVEAGMTDWPALGMSMKVSLLTSEYRSFPIAEALALKEDWPEIWDKGEEAPDFEKLSGGDNNSVRAREKWAARNVDGWDLAAVVSQVRHLIRGSRGIEHMREVLSLEKERMTEARKVQPVQEPQMPDIDAVLSSVMERGVLPAIEAAIRRHSGRVS